MAVYRAPAATWVRSLAGQLVRRALTPRGGSGWTGGPGRERNKRAGGRGLIMLPGACGVPVLGERTRHGTVWGTCISRGRRMAPHRRLPDTGQLVLTGTPLFQERSRQIVVEASQGAPRTGPVAW